MRRAVVVVAGMLVMLWASPTLANHAPSLSASGTISFPGPTELVVGGVTELLAPCEPDSDLQGFDGYWINISGFGNHTGRITTDDLADFDGYFYDEDCDLILDDAGESSLAQNFFEDEVGQIPSNARWVIVDLLASAGAATFTFTAS